MTAVVCGRFDPGEAEAWWQALPAAAPEVRWWTLEQARADPLAVDAAVVANPPPGSLQGLPRLRLIQSLWAGVDRLLADPTLPHGVPLARMVDPSMSQAMAQTAAWAVLALHRGFFAYARRQARGEWRVHGQRRADEVPVLLLGAGEMGGAVQRALQALGYPVSTWRRAEGQTALPARLAAAQVVVNLLPLTPQTHGLIDRHFLAQLPRGAALVNLARGAHVVDDDLLAALDSGHLRHAVLDVFHTEPLPADHRFWRHAQVTVLPHVAAMTDPRSAATVVADNLRRVQQGLPPRHGVARERGY
jgi:glyoxylate/hydroxypyruvate reductase A